MCACACARTPPFSCNIMLNGHEWVANHKQAGQLDIIKEDNCFTSYKDGEKLSQIADTLGHQGQLGKACQRWVYGCLWFALDYEAQKKTGFSYKFSVYQVEYSRNFLFKRGRQLDDAYQHIINLTRERIGIPYLKTLLGRKSRPYITKRHPSVPGVHVQTPDYNLTVFKIHVGKLTLKLYDKGERTLQPEVVVHNTKELGCKRSLGYFEGMVTKLNGLMGSFINNLECRPKESVRCGRLWPAVPGQSTCFRYAGAGSSGVFPVAIQKTFFQDQELLPAKNRQHFFKRTRAVHPLAIFTGLFCCH